MYPTYQSILSNEENTNKQQPGFKNMRQSDMQDSPYMNKASHSFENSHISPDVVNTPHMVQNVNKMTYYKNCTFVSPDAEETTVTCNQIARPQYISKSTPCILQNAQISDMLNRSPQVSHEQNVDTMKQNVIVCLPLETNMSHQSSTHSDQNSNNINRRDCNQSNMEKNRSTIKSQNKLDKVSNNKQPLHASEGLVRNVLVGRTVGQNSVGQSPCTATGNIATAVQNSNYYFQDPWAQISAHTNSSTGSVVDMRDVHQNNMNNVSAMQNSFTSKQSKQSPEVSHRNQSFSANEYHTKNSHLRKMLLAESTVKNNNEQIGNTGIITTTIPNILNPGNITTLQNSPNILNQTQNSLSENQCRPIHRATTDRQPYAQTIRGNTVAKNVFPNGVTSNDFSASDTSSNAANQSHVTLKQSKDNFNDLNMIQQSHFTGTGKGTENLLTVNQNLDRQPKNHQMILVDILCSKFRDYLKKFDLLSTDKFSVLYSALSISAKGNNTTDTLNALKNNDKINYHSKSNNGNTNESTFSKVPIVVLNKITPVKRTRNTKGSKDYYNNDNNNGGHIAGNFSDDERSSGDDDFDYKEKDISPKKLRNTPRPFTLPPEYKVNDSKWTLKHLKAAVELQELMPGTGVYINRKKLSNCKKLSRDHGTLAKLLLQAIFTQKALSVCSFSGKPNTFNTPVRPGLDKHARTVLLAYVKKYGQENNWGIFDRKAVSYSLRCIISSTRNSYHYRKRNQ